MQKDAILSKRFEDLSTDNEVSFLSDETQITNNPKPITDKTEQITERM